jgi:hypothetical protein
MPRLPLVSQDSLTMTKPQDFGDADRGHRQIIALQPHTDLGHHPAGHTGDNHGRHKPERDGQLETTQMFGGDGRGHDRRSIGTDREEPGNAGIEQTTHAPLHIERKTEHGVDAAGDQHADQIEKQTGEFHYRSLPLNSPCGRNRSSATMMKKATADL